jgi:hypothetical protein
LRDPVGPLSANTRLIGTTSFTTVSTIRDNIVRAGLNYKFDWGPVVAKDGPLRLKSGLWPRIRLNFFNT